MIQTSKNKEFLDWLSKRLENKYQEEIDIVKHIQYIRDNFLIVPKKISLSFIDTICKKHFPDFDMDKCKEFSGGFDEDERRKIRSIILDTLIYAERNDS